MASTSTPPPNLDPPFRGYIENTFDALLVFEAARRGMIPRVTRRLIERERGMVQSGAVFVFDEHESGIKRWTDGLVWSPSRILGNFLVYRETDKRSGNPPTPMSTSGPSSSSPSHGSPSGSAMGRSSTNMGAPPNPYDPNGIDVNPVLGHGALPRPRSASEGGGGLDRQRERQLVGSLTNSYKFKENGLVKKTMSVTVNGFAQHMISYYSVEDVMRGKLRSPSTVPELASLEISPEYLHKQNFRFPPMIEIGQDGIPRYRGEPEEPQSPTSPVSSLSIPNYPPSNSGEIYDQYGQMTHPPSLPHQSPSSRQRSVTVPMPIPLPGPASPHTYHGQGPSSAGSGYYDHSQPGMSIASPPPFARQSSNSSLASVAGAMRPGSSSRRYDPYGPASASPRMSVPSSGGIHARRQSQPIAPIPTGVTGDYYPASPTYDVKPNISSPVVNSYHYQPPATAPSAFADFGAYPGQSPNTYAPQYGWPQHPGRFPSQPRDYTAPSSSGSSGSTGHVLPPHQHHAPPPLEGVQENGGWANHAMIPAAPHSAGWDASPYPGQENPNEWRGQGQGTSVG